MRVVWLVRCLNFERPINNKNVMDDEKKKMKKNEEFRRKERER